MEDDPFIPDNFSPKHAPRQKLFFKLYKKIIHEIMNTY